MNRKGFTLVEVMIVVAIIALLAAIAIPNLLRARIQASEAAAQAGLKTLATAEVTYRTSNAAYGTLVNLNSTTPPYIDPVLASGSKNSYTFAVTAAADTFLATAVNTTVGARSFCIQHDGVLHVQAAGGAIATAAACDGLPAVQ